MTTIPRHPKRILLAATLVAAGAFFAVGAGTAAAAPAASLQPTNTCWKDVVNDWLRHQPNLTGTYAIPCYTQAIQHLSRYPDVAGYSSATDDIHRAQLARIRQDRGTIGPGGGGSSGGGGGPPGRGGPDSGGGASGGDKGGSFVRSISDKVGPGDAQSVPLPLLVLGGLALLLLLAAAATWLARRLQARRVTPAPAPAPRRS
jgi:hypothetical protein